MLLPALILACGFLAQEPSDQLQRSLVSEEADERYAAALQLSMGDQEAEKWLLKASHKGTPERRRTLLLAAALMGTEGSLELVEKAARKGRKPDQQRAYALVLYGAMHPQAGLDPKKDWARAASDFERGCLLSGLLAQPERLANPEWKKLIAKKKVPGLTEIYDVAGMLRGEAWIEEPQDVSSLATRVLTTHIPGVAGVASRLLIGETASSLPPLWLIAARRVPARNAADLRGQALVDNRIALVLSLYEVEVDQRQALFDHFRTRTVGKQEAGWLWGAAGDLRLVLPPPQGGKLKEAHVAGLLRLALQDFNTATTTAEPYLLLARKSFQSKLALARRWPAAVLLALGGQESDREILKAAFLAATGSERQRLQPIWKFANRSLGTARASWLKTWSRDLGAGWIGFLDTEGPRWTAYQLVGGTVTAEGRPELATFYPGLQLVPRDYSADAVLYRDLAVLLLDGVYRWGLGD